MNNIVEDNQLIVNKLFTFSEELGNHFWHAFWQYLSFSIQTSAWPYCVGE